MPGRVVIVGTGIAGAAAAQTLRKDGFDGEVVMIGADRRPPYRRTMLTKDLLSGRVDADRIPLRSADAWQTMPVEIRTGTWAADLDPVGRSITTEDVSISTEDGSITTEDVGTGARATLDYDALLLATGGRARRLDPPGGPAWPGVLHVRDAEDALALRSRIGEAVGAPGPRGRLVIVGAGLIGCEVAAVAAAAGVAVTLLEAGPRPLAGTVPEAVSEMLADLHAGHGVTIETGVQVTGVVGETDSDTSGKGVSVVQAADGRKWTAGVVVGAVGMIPATELAQSAGLDVADGILVDEYCATSAPGVYAAGDAARFPDPFTGGTCRIEHWNHGQAHGAAAARAILGNGRPYREVPWCWTHQYGVNLQIAGTPQAADEWRTDGDLGAREFLSVGFAAGQEVAAVAAGRPKELRAARARIGEHLTWSGAPAAAR
ncbi:NAD(P)/FAD-dependent oxidoreductase [Tomitella cavernea]|uniref:FAD-dependent oxidoreductase n=1 Tax=Tomitella cavernea TaxID=1387982 RepID=A0ABP9CYV3_9ACTN|nr:FAD-dependent oxidoreductase [Tomitella cavernea]